MVCPLTSERRLWSVATFPLRPDRRNCGVKAGRVARDHSFQWDLRSRTSRGVLPIPMDSQVWTAGACSSHAAKSSASRTRTSRHEPSLVFRVAHSSLSDQRRGVTKTNVASAGVSARPSAVRVFQSFSALRFGSAATLISHPESPFGTKAVPRSASTIPSQAGRWTPSSERTWSLLTPAPPLASIRRRTTSGRTL